MTRNGRFDKVHFALDFLGFLQPMGIFRNMWRGDAGPGRTILNGWMVPSFFLLLFVIVSGSRVSPAHAGQIQFQILLWASCILGRCFLLWQVFACILIWRNTRTIRRRITRIPVSLLPVIVFCSLFAVSRLYFQFGDKTVRDSSDVESTLEFDVNYPYVGFWKTNCSDSFGTVFEKASHGYYTKIFCGAGGCSDRDEEAKTRIIGDPRFEIINQTTIAEKHHNQTVTLHNCTFADPEY